MVAEKALSPVIQEAWVGGVSNRCRGEHRGQAGDRRAAHSLALTLRRRCDELSRQPEATILAHKPATSPQSAKKALTRPGCMIPHLAPRDSE